MAGAVRAIVDALSDWWPTLAQVTAALGGGTAGLLALLRLDRGPVPPGEGEVSASSVPERVGAVLLPELVAEHKRGERDEARQRGSRPGAGREEEFGRRAELAARERAARLVVEMTTEQRAAIAYLAADAERRGLSVPHTAATVRPGLGLHTRWAAAVARRYDDELARQVKAGRTEADATAAATRSAQAYRRRLVASRATNIARTELAWASNAGRLAQARELLGDGARKVWVTARDDRLCPICEPLNGVVVAMGDEFTGGRGGRFASALLRAPHPPIHPSCRCSVVVREPVARHVQRTPRGQFLEHHGPDAPKAPKVRSLRAGMREWEPADKERLRSRGYVVPPAWTDVQVAEDQTAALQVLGRDSKGRPQYLYSAEHTANQAAAKFARAKAFGKISAALDGTLAKDFKDPAAGSVVLMRRMGLRPGSTRDTGAKEQAYGATTLLAGQVTVERNKATFAFVGKKGVRINLTSADPLVLSAVRHHQAGKGADEPLFGSPPPNAAAYLKSKAPGFKLKDLRTVFGSSYAKTVVDGMDRPQGAAAVKKARREVGEKVSAVLGNTPTVALESYINPSVFAPWEGADG